jgi:hypothetical protein
MTDQQPPPPAQAPEPPPLLPPSPPPPAGEWTAPVAGAATPATPARPASKVRLYIIGAVVIALLVVGGYFISQNQNAGDLAIGQCFDEPSSSVDISTVVKHACTDAHDAEVIHVAEYDEGGTYPITVSVDNFVDENCVPVFQTYVGESYAESTEYSLNFFYPDETGWKQGDRTFTCYVTREDGTKLTQSVKGAANE